MKNDQLLTDEEVAIRHQRLQEAIHLHRIEQNPLTDEEIEIFEMSLRERWPDEKRRKHLEMLTQERLNDLAE